MVWFYFAITFVAILLIGLICKGIMPNLTKSFNDILITVGGIGTVFYGMMFVICIFG
jgi:hypothetical protein